MDENKIKELVTDTMKRTKFFVEYVRVLALKGKISNLKNAYDYITLIQLDNHYYIYRFIYYDLGKPGCGDTVYNFRYVVSSKSLVEMVIEFNEMEY